MLIVCFWLALKLFIRSPITANSRILASLFRSVRNIAMAVISPNAVLPVARLRQSGQDRVQGEHHADDKTGVREETQEQEQWVWDGPVMVRVQRVVIQFRTLTRDRHQSPFIGHQPTSAVTSATYQEWGKAGWYLWLAVDVNVRRVVLTLNLLSLFLWLRYVVYDIWYVVFGLHDKCIAIICPEDLAFIHDN